MKFQSDYLKSIFTYQKIYKKLMGYSFSWGWSISSHFIISVISMIMFYYLNDKTVFLIHLLSHLVTLADQGSMKVLFSNLSTMPIKKNQVIFYNYLSTWFGIDHLISFVLLLAVFFLNNIKLYEIILFFLCIAALAFISQVICYAYFLYEHYFTKQLIFIFFLLLILLIIPSEGLRSGYNIPKMFWDNFAWCTFFVLFLCIAISPFFVAKLLSVPKVTVPFYMIRISNILSKVVYIVPINRHLKFFIECHFKIFLRNQEILQKYITVTLISIIYATVGTLFLQFHDTSFLLSNMSMGISLYIFVNIKLESILYRASLFKHYSLSSSDERIVLDISGLLLTVLFGGSALAYQSLIISASVEDFLRGALLLIVFHYVGMYFRNNITQLIKRQKITMVVKYFLIVVFTMTLLNNVEPWFAAIVSLIFITLTSYKLHTK
jgi:hypothetical protein